MHGAASIWSEMQCKCVAVVYIAIGFGWVCPCTSLHRNKSARLAQERVKSSNLEHVVRCWLHFS